MSRPLRLEYPGALFHVTARGNEKRRIFRDNRDRSLFLDLLGVAAARFAWILPAYALMPNHVHLLVQLSVETLSKGMHWLDGEYARQFNHRHARVGHLFQGRFKAKLIEKETYFLEVLRYVVLNPVRAGIVARPEDDRWTSHRAVIGAAPAPEWLAVDDVLAEFGPDCELARANYCAFVNAAVGIQQDLWKNLVGQIYLGNDPWRDQVRARIELKPRSNEHPRAQRLIGRVSMATVIQAVAGTFAIDEARLRNGPDRTPRMVAAWIGCREALLTGPQVAAGLLLRSASHASALARRCDQELESNEQLREAVDRCLSTIRRKSPIADLTPNSSS